MTHQQDLTIFNDNSIISDKILQSANNYTSIITHTQGTSPIWLINALIENSLYGSCYLNNEAKKSTVARSDVVLVSFMYNIEAVEKSLKKSGIDISSIKNFTFVDMFSDLFSKVHDKKDIVKIFQDLATRIEMINNPAKIVIIDTPEILLYSTDIDATELIYQINKINKLCKQLTLVVSSDDDLIDLGSTVSNTLEFKLTDFLTRLFQKSNLNLCIQPLETGRANDITGSLNISRGLIPYEDISVVEREYLYFVSKESNVKLFFR